MTRGGPTMDIHTESAAVYDAVYESMMDFAAAADRIHELIGRHARRSGATLLDVACGTGAYLTHLRGRYAVEGLDLSAGMLAVARRKLPAVPLHHADIADFDLGRRFDALTCLGSSIGYVRTIPRLRHTLQTFARHLLPGGVLIVEPWFEPGGWIPGHLAARLVEQPDLKIARLSISSVDGRLSTMEMHYLIASPQGIEHFSEHHEMGLFPREEYLAAFKVAGLNVVDEQPSFLSGRGLNVAVAPLAAAAGHA